MTEIKQDNNLESNDELLNKYEDKQYFPRIADSIVRFYTYSAVVGLIFYMLATLGQSFYIALRSVGDVGVSKSLSEKDMLHTVAFTIVLVKAYKVLMEYARTQHVNIKFIIEIAIIAPVIELLFNFDSTELNHMYFLGIFSGLMTMYYLYFYDTISRADEDYHLEHEKEFNARIMRLERLKKRKLEKIKKNRT